MQEAKPKGLGMAVTAMATELSEAVRKDEAGEGCDIAAGLYGPNVSALIKRWAEDYLRAAAG
jgi:hypothetical protein